ncbi:MAG: hypothetical protein LUF89_03055 [Ruminococcus sp.]|nr:hypothetical protein [Ruminococcus sp.]
MKMQSNENEQRESVCISAADVIALMRKSRRDALCIVFRYGDEVYTVGVNPKNGREPFFFCEESYPSMFAFCSGAAIDGGFLLLDLQDKLEIISINGASPSDYFQKNNVLGENGYE